MLSVTSSTARMHLRAALSAAMPGLAGLLLRPAVSGAVFAQVFEELLAADYRAPRRCFGRVLALWVVFSV